MCIALTAVLALKKHLTPLKKELEAVVVVAGSQLCRKSRMALSIMTIGKMIMRRMRKSRNTLSKMAFN
jgi:hypothetical protein